MRLSQKIPLGIVFCTLVTGVIVGTLGYTLANHALKEAEFNSFDSLLSARSSHLTSYLKSIQEDIEVMSESREIGLALQQFEGAWNELQSQDVKKQLHDAYIHKNANPAGQKEKLDYVDDGSSYGYVHQQRHPWFRELLYKKGFYDIFLISLKGDVVYTVYKELDFATNLLKGEWKDTDLALAFREAVGDNKRESHFYDFKPYAPSNNAAAAFISRSIVDERNEIIGVLVFQMPIARINEITANSFGLGESGETYLVGEDSLMRSDSRFIDKTKGETSILKTKVDSTSVSEAIEGKTGHHTIQNYRNFNVISAYSPLEFLGVKWALIGEIKESEIFAPVTNLLWNVIYAVLIANALIGACSVYVAGNLCKLIASLSKAMKDLADKDLSIEIPGVGRKDEIGEMSLALAQFKENAIQVVNLTEEQNQQEERQNKEKEENEKKRRAGILNMAAEFEDQVQGIASMIAATSTELCATADNMKHIVANISTVANTVSDSSTQTAENVKGVAFSIDKMSSSIQQIMGQIAKSMEVVNGAVNSAKTADTTVHSLSDAVFQIGEISEVIEGITGRINLLALNATIESARAGEVGRGFGVVASQVKNLAGQTAQATTQIIDNITNVRDVSEQVASVLSGIQISITDVNKYSSLIASAFEEQSRSTNKIAENMQRASHSVNTINQGITEVSRGMIDADTGAAEVLTVASMLSEQSEKLNQQMSLFLKNIRRDNC
jgi:methyl-accepting chemotaxis protein